MTTQTDIAATEPTIVMSRAYDATRERVWEAITEPKHVKRWWGGAGISNPVCEMDVRPGGLWTHTMRFPDGRELHMKFAFLEVEPPKRLVWEHANSNEPGGPPACRFSVTLEEVGAQTHWRLVARFASLAERDMSVEMGFGGRIEASNDRFAEYLKTM